MYLGRRSSDLVFTVVCGLTQESHRAAVRARRADIGVRVGDRLEPLRHVGRPERMGVSCRIERQRRRGVGKAVGSCVANSTNLVRGVSGSLGQSLRTSGADDALASRNLLVMVQVSTTSREGRTFLILRVTDEGPKGTLVRGFH